MDDMRVLIEHKNPVKGELKSAWFTLPIFEDELLEKLEIEIDSENYIIIDSYVAFDIDEDSSIEAINEQYRMYEELEPDFQAELTILLDYVSNLEELYNRRYDIRHYSSCTNMADVAKEFLEETGLLYEIPENLREHFDYESYGESLNEDRDYVITQHGIFEMSW